MHWPQISQKRIRLPLKEVQYFAKVQRCSYNMLQSLFISTYRFIIAVTIKSIVQSNRLINLSMSIKIELSHKLANFTLNPKYKRSIKRVDLSYCWSFSKVWPKIIECTKYCQNIFCILSISNSFDDSLIFLFIYTLSFFCLRIVTCSIMLFRSLYLSWFSK